MFKVGQKVRCKKYGEGVVKGIDEDEAYPVDVEFTNGEWDFYTKDGKLYEDDDEPRLSVIEYKEKSFLKLGKKLFAKFTEKWK